MDCIGPDLICAWKWLGENITSIIATSAMAVTLWQGYLTRRHNRLSVQPHLVIHKTLTGAAPQIEFELSNDGLGPAIIKSFNMEVSDIKIDENNTPFQVTEICKRESKKITHSAIRHWITGESIKEGAREIALQISGDLDSTALDERHIRNISNQIKFKIKYTSMYGDTFFLEYPTHKDI